MTVWTFLAAVAVAVAISLACRQVLEQVKEKRLRAELERAKQAKHQERIWESKALNMMGKSALPRLVGYYSSLMPDSPKIEIYQRLIADFESDNHTPLGQRQKLPQIAEPLERKSS